jgi:hypothetical protein
VSCLLVKCKYLVLRNAKVILGTRCSLKMSKNMNKRATKRKSAAKNYILKFLTVSSVSSDSIVKGINVLLCTRLYKYAPNLESLLTNVHSKMYA